MKWPVVLRCAIKEQGVLNLRCEWCCVWLWWVFSDIGSEWLFFFMPKMYCKSKIRLKRWNFSSLLQLYRIVVRWINSCNWRQTKSKKYAFWLSGPIYNPDYAIRWLVSVACNEITGSYFLKSTQLDYSSLEKQICPLWEVSLYLVNAGRHRSLLIEIVCPFGQKYGQAKTRTDSLLKSQKATKSDLFRFCWFAKESAG